MTLRAADLRGLAAPRRWPALLLAAAFGAAAGVAGAATADGAPVATVVFDFELLDTSLEGELKGENPDETARLRLISAQLRTLLAASGRYRVIDPAPAAAKIADAGYLRACNGCAAAIARDLGAALAVTGLVQKVSNLILNINIVVRDAASGKPVTAASADIRGNTDASWSHGVAWLVRNRLLAE